MKVSAIIKRETTGLHYGLKEANGCVVYSNALYLLPRESYKFR